MLTVLAMVRWKQWVKNGLVFAPWFAAGMADFAYFDDLLISFLAFSLLSSAIYIFNDLQDLEEDRRHPQKSSRPIAAGTIKQSTARVIAFSSLTVSFALSFFFLNNQATIFLTIYLLTSALYIFIMRNIFLLDIFFLASGFVLRVLFGGATSETPISPWLLVVIGSFALFVAVGKRSSEVHSGNSLLSKRKSLDGYTPEYLQVLLVTALSSVIVSYALWTIEGSENPGLSILSLVPFTFVLLRYLRSAISGQAEAPEQVLFRDPVLIIAIISWILIFSLRFL